MRIHEIRSELNEISHIPDTIGDRLTQAGYRRIGSGVDQEAYYSPDGQFVLKIFGTNFSGVCEPNHRGVLTLTDSQKMFAFWNLYCRRHSDNEFLPRFFSGTNGKTWTPFVYEGCLYLQMWQEPLITQKADAPWIVDLANLCREVRYGNVDLFRQWARDESQVRMDAGTRHRYELLRKQMGPEALEKFMLTVADIYVAGRHHGWSLDLHPGNILQRKDGTPVIVDPWVA